MTTHYRSATAFLSEPSAAPCALVILSPHPDDAVLSCGGIIAAAVAAGQRVVVVTVFTGDAPQLALAWPTVQLAHREWNLGDDAMAQRRAEDQAGLALLGAEGVWCHLLDRLYRSPASRRQGRLARWTTRITDLFSCDSAARSDGQAVAAQLTPLLERLSPERLLAPLAVGNHPDHLATCWAARQWLNSGRQVGFYEDFPYALNPDWLRHRLSRFPHRPTPEIHAIGSHLASRIAASACHRSQIAGLFKHAEGLGIALQNFAGNPARERIWLSGR